MDKARFKDNTVRGNGGIIKSTKGTVNVYNSVFYGTYLIKGIESGYGGSIYLENTKSTISNSIFKDSSAGRYGGAININKSTVTINKSEFNNLEAYDCGGAISIYNYHDNNRIISSNVEIKNSKIINSWALHDGGAIYNEGKLTITNTQLNNNTAEAFNGGAISNNGTLIINSCNITKNEVRAAPTEDDYSDNDYDIPCGNGGAIYSYNGTVTITNSKINNNHAYNGGAITIQNGTLTVTNSQLNNNKADTGGAISASAIITNDDTSINYYYININNCDINNNYANTSSAIYIMDDIESDCKGTLNIINSRIKNNKCPNYSSLYWGGSSYTYLKIIKNSIFF